jgi:magnesium chelatase subunit I
MELNYTDTDEVFLSTLKTIKPLNDLIEKNAPQLSDSDKDFCRELVLWALAVSNKLGKTATDSMYKFDGN